MSTYFQSIVAGALGTPRQLVKQENAPEAPYENALSIIRGLAFYFKLLCKIVIRRPCENRLWVSLPVISHLQRLCACLYLDALAESKLDTGAQENLQTLLKRYTQSLNMS